MRKMVNREIIEGRVFSHKLEEKVTGPASKAPGTKYIAGDLNVAVDEEGINVVTVHFTYVTETTSTGKANATYSTLSKIINEPKTWVDNGPTEAYKVNISTSIALNDFFAKDGSKVSAKKNEGGFVSFVSELKPENERNTFEFDMIINRVTRIEADPEKNVEADYAILKGAVFNFRNELLPVELVVHNEAGMNYFESMDVSSSNPLFTKVWGRINSINKKTPYETETAWGDSVITYREKKEKEWVVTQAAKVPYEFDDESTITAEELKKAIQDRELLWATIKTRNEEYQASKAAATSAPVPAIQQGDYKF